MDAAEPGQLFPDPERFSVRDCDEYLGHLCRISMQEQLVLACTDVRNEFGILLLREGTPLGSHALQRLRGHRLNRALDETFVLRRTPEPAEIAQQMLATLGAEPDLAAITRHAGLEERLTHLCAGCGIPRPLLQKLAVMQRALPHVHHRAMFTAWMGTALASVRALPDADAALLLLAGLLHDIGFLHMEPGLWARRGELSAADWTAVRGHPCRSAEVIAQSWPGAPERLLRIVVEHHERHDGAGYPAGTEGSAQDPLSGIIGLADMLHALRFDASSDRAGNIVDCLPFLRVNRRTWDIANYRPAARLLLAARAVAQPTQDTAPPSPQALMDANRSLGVIVALLPDARTVLGRLVENRTARSLLQLLDELESTSRAAGLGTPTLSGWLQENLREGRTDPGLEEVALTIRESLWLVRRADRQLRDLLQQRQREPDAPQLKDLSLRLRGELTRAWRRFEHPH